MVENFFFGLEKYAKQAKNFQTHATQAKCTKSDLRLPLSLSHSPKNEY